MNDVVAPTKVGSVAEGVSTPMRGKGCAKLTTSIEREIGEASDIDNPGTGSEDRAIVTPFVPTCFFSCSEERGEEIPDDKKRL